mmetsp:Transcript_4151/g.11446  ORF Transcript_4151/g.11446 Transcript_4151/m.11446 type:complete len:229 (-) Transcript_4151:174-860(-)
MAMSVSAVCVRRRIITHSFATTSTSHNESQLWINNNNMSASASFVDAYRKVELARPVFPSPAEDHEPEGRDEGRERRDGNGGNEVLLSPSDLEWDFERIVAMNAIEDQEEGETSDLQRRATGKRRRDGDDPDDDNRHALRTAKKMREDPVVEDNNCCSSEPQLLNENEIFTDGGNAAGGGEAALSANVKKKIEFLLSKCNEDDLSSLDDIFSVHDLLSEFDIPMRACR